jgi:hypothetical protein
MRKYPHIFCALAVILLFAGIGFGQKALNKPVAEWSQDDCYKILQSSPWVRMSGAFNGSRRLNEFTKYGVKPWILIRLSSSATVRQARLRLSQFHEGYDSMTPKQQRAFDQKNDYVSNCDDCDKYYVVTVMQPADPRAEKTLVGLAFRDFKLEDLKGKFYLTNDKDERRELARFDPPEADNGYATFYFDRFDEKGKPLLGIENKRVTFVSKMRSISKEPCCILEPTNDFNVSKITVNNKVDF